MSSAGWDIDRGGESGLSRGRGGGDLADLLERVLDKGVVIAGDIAINLLDIELLTVKLRLLVASADTARQMGIDWWTRDPFLTGRSENDDQRRELEERIERLEATIAALPDRAPGNGAIQGSTGSPGGAVASNGDAPERRTSDEPATS